MSTVALNNLWSYIRGLSLSQSDREWLANRLLEPSYQIDPYTYSPSGDTFFADARNVKAVEQDIAEAHRPEASFTRLETAEDITAMLSAL
ncbi:MAG: hypothetical protein IJ767_07645 [Bacteroidaceae bacterium]|nr:hypothetical protein [Bacteroidaceae bacterium]MBR1801342.1 hypothetical protein [Bacteroidaceae bacterium]